MAIEWQDPKQWRDRALAGGSTPEATLEGLLALTQVSAKDPMHRASEDPAPDAGALRDKILAALARIDRKQLDMARTLDLVRGLPGGAESLWRAGRSRARAPDRPRRWLVSGQGARAEYRASRS